MEEVNNRVAPVWAGGVIRREINKHVAIWRITLEIPFERFAVDFYLFPRTLPGFIPLLCFAIGSNRDRDACGNKDGQSNLHKFHLSHLYLPVARSFAAVEQASTTAK